VKKTKITDLVLKKKVPMLVFQLNKVMITKFIKDRIDEQMEKRASEIEAAYHEIT